MKTVGLVPPAVTGIHPYRYYVGVGETPGSIAEAFTGNPWRYHELVGANRGIALGDAPGGGKYRSFGQLKAGDALCLPDFWETGVDWPALPGSGDHGEVAGVGDAQQDAADLAAPLFATEFTVETLTRSIQAFLTMAKLDISGANALGTILYGWWPYLRIQAVQLLSAKLPLNASAWTSTGDTQLVFGRYLASATFAMGATKLSPSQLASIPWDQVPWDKIPWVALKQRIPNWLANGHVPGRNDLWNAIKVLAPETSMGASNENYTPHFETMVWTEEPWSSIDWTQIPWDAIDWTQVSQNNNIWSCILASDGLNKLEQVVKYRDCLAKRPNFGGFQYFCSGDPATVCAGSSSGSSSSGGSSSGGSSNSGGGRSANEAALNLVSGGSKSDSGSNTGLIIGSIVAVGAVVTAVVLAGKGR